MNGNTSENAELRAFFEESMIATFSKVFKVNLNTGEYEVFKNDGVLDGEVIDDTSDIYAYMKQLIASAVYPEYVTVCQRFTNPEYVRKSVYSGARRIVQSYRRKTTRGDRWVTFTIIATPECGPENPFVLFTWREADSDAITLLDTLPTISSLYDKLIRLNLSNNTYEPVVVGANEQERLVGGVINMNEWWAGYSQNGNVAAEDKGVFSTLTKAGSLQKRFAEDPTPVSFRYRRKVGDEYRWVQLEIAPSIEYSEENQIMLLSLKDIHEEYTAEMRNRQELIDSLNRDALTNLYNRLKFNDDIARLTVSSDPLFTCLYVDLNGLHELNNLLGHQKGDEMLCGVADALRKHFPDEMIYRIGGDEFVVLSTTLPKDDVKFAVNQLRSDLHKNNYEISVGIESGACGESVEKIIAAAEQAMRSDKSSYYLRHGDRRKKRQMNEELEQMLVEKRDNARFLDLITHQFTGVYFVDLSRDASRYIYNPNFFLEFLKITNSSFSEAMRLYVERFVMDEDKDKFNDILNFNSLARKLRKDGVVDLDYQKEDGNRMRLRILDVERHKSIKPETLWMFWKKPR